MQESGKYIIFIGIAVVLIGLLLYFAGDKFNWFGNLPGDIKVKKENFSFYMPLSSMLIVSIGLSFLFWLLKKLF